MKKIIALTFTSLVLSTSSAFAWGARGHKMVAQIAKKYMDQSTIDSVQHYLDKTSFESAAVWMDEIRGDHSYDYLKPMHYVNVEKDKTYVKVNDANIMNELSVVISGLQNRKGKTADEIKTDLMILFHLTGDIHMPLHAGYADDKGGNAVDVEFMGFTTNLHKVWDTSIIEEQNITTENCLEYIKTLSADEIKEIQSAGTLVWLNDSRALLNNVYAFKDGAIDKSYITKNTPVIEKQLSKAGLRLAATLTKLFSKDPKFDTTQQ